MEGFKDRREGAERPRPWTVADEFSESRDRERGNEDGYIIADHCVAVLDGVSARGSKERIYKLTPGQFAVKLGKELMQSPDVNAGNIVERLTNSLRTTVGGHALQHPPSFVFAAFFPKEHVIVRVGDCSYLIDGSGSNPALNVDRAKGILRRRTLQKLRAKGYTDEDLIAFKNSPEQRKKDEELRLWQEHFSNNIAAPDFSYGVINGSEVPPHLVDRIAVPSDASEIVLASDGYPPEILRPTLAESEAALRELQRTDPVGIQGEPSTRPHRPPEGHTSADDRTYIRVVR
jgi:hypothetical protein